MNESFSQPNQEKNLALERQEAVKLHNEILKEQESLPDTEKQEATDKVAEMSTLREKVGNIDKYKDLAKPFNDQYYYRVGDISSVEKLNKEKEKIDTEVEKVKSVIEETANKLNELRQKLGMEPTTDIPSLDIKKERLPYLLKIQSDLENKLNSETKKQEVVKSENLEQGRLEEKFLKNSLEELSQTLRKMVGNEDSFGFKIIASGLEDFSDMDDLKLKLSKIVISAESFAKNGLKDNLDALHDDAMKFSQIEASLRNLPSKIKSEEERKEFGQFISNVAGKISEVTSFIRLKASRLQDYLNVK